MRSKIIKNDLLHDENLDEYLPSKQTKWLLYEYVCIKIDRSGNQNNAQRTFILEKRKEKLFQTNGRSKDYCWFQLFTASQYDPYTPLSAVRLCLQNSKIRLS